MAAGFRGRRRHTRAETSADPPAHRLVAAAGRIASGRTTVAVVYRAGASDGAVARGTLVDPRAVVVDDLPGEFTEGDLVVVVASRSADDPAPTHSERFLVDRAARVLGRDGDVAGYVLFLNAPSSLPVADVVAPAPSTDEPEQDERVSDALVERHRLRWEDVPLDDLPPTDVSIWRTIARALGFG